MNISFFKSHQFSNHYSNSIFLNAVVIVFFITVFLNFSSAAERSEKILLLGIDGATWYAAKPLVTMGQTPVIAKFMEHGVYGNLISVENSRSPIIWTSVVTGKTMEKHGIADFTIKREGSYEQQPPSSFHRKCKAIWNIATEKDKTAGFINWWASWPAEEISGYVISFYVFHLGGLIKNMEYKPGTRLTYPDSLYTTLHPVLKPDKHKIQNSVNFVYDKHIEVKQELKVNQVQSERLHKDLKGYIENMIDNDIIEFVSLDQAVANAATYMMKHQEVNYQGVYFQGLDVAGHLTWKFYEPVTPAYDYEVPSDQVVKYRTVYRNYYRYTDGLLGEVLAHVDEKTTVLLCSDHGMGAVSPKNKTFSYRLNFLFEKLGWLKTKDGNIYWPETLVYDPNNIECWRRDRKIFLNQKGREEQGVIDSAVQLKQLRDMMMDTLKKLKTDTGKLLIQDISMDFANRNDYKDQDGDFWIIINPDLEMTDKLLLGQEAIPLTEIMVPRTLSGNHMVKGLFAAALNNIDVNKRVQNVSFYDITPTMLMLTGLPIGRDMDGKALRQIFTPEFRRTFKPEFIDTYDVEGERKAKEQRSDVADAVLDRLGKLGYIR